MIDTNHTFVVCAYKESQFLEQCVQSLIKQTIHTNIMMVTSTPNEHISSIAEKYNIPLLIRDGASDICKDWNYACSVAKTEWVTVAHQDDCYDSRYVEELLKSIKKDKKSSKASIFITDYKPIKHGMISRDANCIIRKLLKTPLRISWLAKHKKVRAMTLALGNSICCPTVTYHKTVTGEPVFTSELKYNIDWDTFLKYALYDAPFLYVPKALVFYRIHNESTSAEYIADSRRVKDDIYMFNRFWPKWFTEFIMIFYKRAYKTYEN